jgi:hypothetical protein
MWVITERSSNFTAWIVDRIGRSIARACARDLERADRRCRARLSPGRGRRRTQAGLGARRGTAGTGRACMPLPTDESRSREASWPPAGSCCLRRPSSEPRPRPPSFAAGKKTTARQAHTQAAAVKRGRGADLFTGAFWQRPRRSWQRGSSSCTGHQLHGREAPVNVSL